MKRKCLLILLVVFIVFSISFSTFAYDHYEEGISDDNVKLEDNIQIVVFGGPMYINYDMTGHLENVIDSQGTSGLEGEKIDEDINTNYKGGFMVSLEGSSFYPFFEIGIWSGGSSVSSKEIIETSNNTFETSIDYSTSYSFLETALSAGFNILEDSNRLDIIPYAGFSFVQGSWSTQGTQKYEHIEGTYKEKDKFIDESITFDDNNETLQSAYFVGAKANIYITDGLALYAEGRLNVINMPDKNSLPENFNHSQVGAGISIKF